MFIIIEDTGRRLGLLRKRIERCPVAICRVKAQQTYGGTANCPCCSIGLERVPELYLNADTALIGHPTDPEMHLSIRRLLRRGVGTVLEAWGKEGIFNRAKKFAESGNYDKAAELITPHANNGVDDAKVALNEVEYSFILANKNDTDESTCRYLIEFKEIERGDTADIFNGLYTLSVSGGSLSNKPIRLYNNMTYSFQIYGVMPDGLETRMATISSIVEKGSIAKLIYWHSGRAVSYTSHCCPISGCMLA